MPSHTKIAVAILFGSALTLGAFFIISARNLHTLVEITGVTRLEPLFPIGEELDALLPVGAREPLSQEFVDLNGDGRSELVVGYAVTGSGDSLLPHLRAFFKVSDRWQLRSEFAFPREGTFANAASWPALLGRSSFERKDIDGDHREELFVRLATNDSFFRAVGIVVWQEDRLTWLPLTGKDSVLLLPIFSEGGTTRENRRLFVEDANRGEGLEIIFAHGTVDPLTGIERWSYEIYEKTDGTYSYNALLSRLYSASGRRPAP